MGPCPKLRSVAVSLSCMEFLLNGILLILLNGQNDTGLRVAHTVE